MRACLLGGSLLIIATPVCAQTRVALVVGNNAYLRVPPLNNAVNDAAAISEELRKFGFQVIRVLDGKAREISDAKQRFISAVANGGIGVFYFSGHGIQVEGRNYLLPVDFSTISVAGLAQEGISVPSVLDEIEKAKPRLNIVILDACRDNPFPTPRPRCRRPGDCRRWRARCRRARWCFMPRARTRPRSTPFRTSGP